MKEKDKSGKNKSNVNLNNLKNSKKEDIIINHNEIEIDGFQAYIPNMPTENSNKKINLGNVINPFEIKNSDDFLNSWKTLEELENAKEQYELFDDLWDNIIKINKNNILDYSLINKIINFLEDDFMIQRFLFLLYNIVDDSLDNYLKEENYFFIFKNNLIFFMLILMNLKNNKRFCFFFGEKKLEYLNLLLPKIQKIKNNKVKIFANNILFKLFSFEYIHLGLNSILFNENEKNKNNEIIIEKHDKKINDNKFKDYKILNNFYQLYNKNQIKEEINKEKYIEIVESLFNFDSINFLNYKQNRDVDFPYLFMEQIELVKNIILIIFSKEKYLYLKKGNIFYEYEFLDKLIKKNITETKEMHGDKYRNLFRRDTISNNIIKYIFFLFGNNMIIESLIKPLNTILNIIGLNKEFEVITFQGKSLKEERIIAKDEFNILLDKIIEKLKINMPLILRIFLKILYENVIKEYPNLEKNDYTPLSSLFFFSYLSNPRIQQIFEIFPEKNLFIKSVYRLIYNASFNIKFKENDNLNIFNEEIEKYHIKIKEFYVNNIINVDIYNENNKKYLKNFFEEIGVEFPGFLFYLSCDYIYDLNKNLG